MSAQALPHPHDENGRMTVRVAATPDQTWALDADYLYKRMDVLQRLGAHYANRISLLDLVADGLLLAGVLSTFFIAWWTCVPIIGFACLQKIANKRMAGELAGKAAQESTDAFLYLYNSGALWLEQPTNRIEDPLRRFLSR